MSTLPANTHSRTERPAVRGVQCIYKALELLCCFSPDRTEWGVTELAKHLGLPKSAAHRILVTCEQFRFVERTNDRRYRLGAKMLELGHVYRFDQRLLKGAERVLQSLAASVGGIAHLGELDGDDVLELMRAEGKNAVRFRSSPKLRMSAHATALGKVLLSRLPQDVRERYFSRHVQLPRFTQHTTVDPGGLREQLETIARAGYAVSDQESMMGCRCLAVPIRHQLGQVVAAISISGPRACLAPERDPELVATLWRAARAIEQSL